MREAQSVPNRAFRGRTDGCGRTMEDLNVQV